VVVGGGGGLGFVQRKKGKSRGGSSDHVMGYMTHMV